MNSYEWAIKRKGEQDVIRYGNGAYDFLIGTPVTYRTKEEAEGWCISEGSVVVKAADYPAYVSGYEE